MLRRNILRVLIPLVLAGVAYGQACAPGSGILRLMQVDTCRDNVALMECLSKMQLSTSQMCSIQLQHDLKMASDGTFCETSKGVQSRASAVGKYTMGRSDLDFEIKSTGNPAYPGMLVMNLKGRVVPNGGGREIQVDCNMLFNVTAGSALGVVSLGSDSLMSTTYTGPPIPASSGYGAANGYSLPGSGAGQGVSGSLGMQGALPGTVGMPGNGMIQGTEPGSLGMMPGQQAMGINGPNSNAYQAATSAAAAAAVAVCSKLLLATTAMLLLLRM